ncbi:MAG: zinc ribbon domain-containing protein [Lachnospiraceae bacterium]|nr:zinc ribbon domain-containing protein [Lachnospiraceae bacterium]
MQEWQEWFWLICGIFMCIVGFGGGSIVVGIVGILFTLLCVGAIRADKKKESAQTSQTQQPKQPQQFQQSQQSQPKMTANISNTPSVQKADVCPLCGEKVKSEALFCNNCGTKLP